MQHAVALARGGQWMLLDALELLARSDETVCILHAPGAVALVGLSEEPDGEWDDDWDYFVGNPTRWATLSGEDSDFPGTFPGNRHLIQRDDATEIVGSYTRLVDWLKNADART